MSFTTNDLAAVEQAIATGALRVRIKDVDTQFRSQEDLLSLRTLIKKELDDSTRDKPRAYNPILTTGL